MKINLTLEEAKTLASLTSDYSSSYPKICAKLQEAIHHHQAAKAAKAEAKIVAARLAGGDL